MTLLVIDYGAGTVLNVARAFERIGAQVSVGSDVGDHDRYVLPGVGHFAYCASLLRDGRVDLDRLKARIDGGAKLLGICVGAQLLFDSSEEAPLGPAGLGWIPGDVRRVKGRAPRIGWYPVEGQHFYFVHSYELPAPVVRLGNFTAVQFHPERSGTVGQRFLKEWLGEEK